MAERKRKMIKEYSDLVDFHCQGKGLKEDKKLTMVLVNHSMKQQTRFFVLFKLNSQITTAQALASELWDPNTLMEQLMLATRR